MNIFKAKKFFATLWLSVLIGCTSTLGPQLGQSGVPAADPANTVKVKLIALNDFHGYLNRSENAVVYLSDPDNPTEVVEVEVGGAPYIASLIKKLKAENPNAMVVGAGDLVGASPAISSFTQDEATINIMGQIGLEVSAVGNHEFDRGKQELRRLQTAAVLLAK